ncbi:IS1380 family transposase, partial [Micromonospora sp. NPDC047707]|uniref:IS1380 family transposase n=1 Tax=Micromonospora sp. NPDC047707 TaxID=3154498 RepID=UPI003451A3BE
MQGSHAFRADGAVFDEDNLVSHAGLVPLLELAEQAGLSLLLDEHVRFVDERITSGAANATPKLTSIIAGMAAGADSIDDLDVIRAGGTKKLFGGVYAAATLGILLREFTHGHARQLQAVLSRHLVALAQRTAVLDGIDDRVFVDIDSLLRPVYGHAKQGASFGHTKIAGKTILRRGLSPLAVTISTETAAPVVAGVRLRAGRAGSSRGAASMLTEAINTAIACGADPMDILVRGDSAYCAGKVVTAVVKAGATFSFAITRNPAVDAAISSISDEQYTPVHYPGAVVDPDTGHLISDAQVSEVEYTAFADTRHAITGRLIVRRVLDTNTQDPLFPVWRYHPFFTNNTEAVTDADITHRRHAICETVWSDLIDDPWAHQPSGIFGANAAWTILAAICHNLL